MIVPQFGVADEHADSEGALISCGSNLQAPQDQDVLDRNLFKVITQSDYRATREALKAGANPNAIADLKTLMEDQVLEEGAVKIDSNSVGATALHTAVMVGNPHIVNLLLEFKAKTDIKNSSGFTAFSLLAYQYHIDDVDRNLMVEFFIESGPAESDITKVFNNSVTTWNIPVAEAIAKYAPESKVITDLKNIRLGIFDLMNYIIDCMFLPIDEVHKEQRYHLMSKHLAERGLLK